MNHTTMLLIGVSIPIVLWIGLMLLGSFICPRAETTDTCFRPMRRPETLLTPRSVDRTVRHTRGQSIPRVSIPLLRRPSRSWNFYRSHLSFFDADMRVPPTLRPMGRMPR